MSYVVPGTNRTRRRHPPAWSARRRARTSVRAAGDRVRDARQPGRPPGRGLTLVRRAVQRVHRGHAEIAQRLGLPVAAPGVADEGQVARSVRWPRTRSATIRPPGWPPRRRRRRSRPTRPGRSGRADARLPVAGHAEHARPAVVDRARPRRPGTAAQPALEAGDRAGRDLAVPVGARPEAVRHAATAERDPAVRRALDVHVRVRESWIVSAASQPIAASASGESGSVAIIERVHRQQPPAAAADRRRVALGGADDPVRRGRRPDRVRATPRRISRTGVRS